MSNLFKFKVSNPVDMHIYGKKRTAKLGGFEFWWPFPMVRHLRSSSAVIMGHAVFMDPPAWVKPVYRVASKLYGAKLWVYYRLHPKHRYHVVKTELPYGYHERDEQLMYSMIACLKGYVQDCRDSGVHRISEEAVEILAWWEGTRPADQAKVKQMSRSLYEGKGKELKTKEVVLPNGAKLHEVVLPEESDADFTTREAMWALQEKIQADADKFLHRIVGLRQSMWT